jgi:ADP-ribose pyrophosphatase YjhB (NUDIX family)
MSHYCYICGQTLCLKNLDGREREVCPKCSWVQYEHRKVSAALRVVKDGKLLLVQRGIEPWLGAWYMPAGYLEVDEDPKICAARETLEETGLHVQVGDLLQIYTYEDDPRGNGIVLLYTGTVIGGELKPSPESTRIDFFPPQAIFDLPMAGAGAKKQIFDWLSEINNQVE